MSIELLTILTRIPDILTRIPDIPKIIRWLVAFFRKESFLEIIIGSIRCDRHFTGGGSSRSDFVAEITLNNIGYKPIEPKNIYITLLENGKELCRCASVWNEGKIAPNDHKFKKIEHNLNVEISRGKKKAVFGVIDVFGKETKKQFDVVVN